MEQQPMQDDGTLPAAAPPDAPLGLLSMPAAWLLRLTQFKRSSYFSDAERRKQLHRTCTFFRDELARGAASVTINLQRQTPAAELQRQELLLCAVVRRFASVTLIAYGDGADVDSEPRWTPVEPQLTCLLGRVAAHLGGPLANVKHVELHWMRQTALVPAWLKDLCPNVARLTCQQCEIINPPVLPSPAPAGQAYPPLQQLAWDPLTPCTSEPAVAACVRQQLAALPGLTSLTLGDWQWADVEDDDDDDDDELPGRVSASVTAVQMPPGSDLRGGAPALQHVRRLFPSLQQLVPAGWIVMEWDGSMDLLQGPTLADVVTGGRLVLRGFDLEDSHEGEPWPWPHIEVKELDVDSFARLPLERVQSCVLGSSLWNHRVTPSADLQAVARVAQAVRRWGGAFLPGRMLTVDCGDEEAALATLGPLLQALDEGGGGGLRTLKLGSMCGARGRFVQRLARLLPATVTSLRLSSESDETAMAAGSWPELLPNLPASVVDVDVGCVVPFEHKQEWGRAAALLALCTAAVRPVKVHALCVEPEEARQVLRELERTPGKAGLVTLPLAARR